MPELPEVEMIRQYIEQNCLTRRISDVQIYDNSILKGTKPTEMKKALRGASFKKAKRHGKQLFLLMDTGRIITLHLGMTGDILLLPPRKKAPLWTRVRVDFSDSYHLVYVDLRKFGGIGLTSSIEEFVAEKRLGPDALQVKKEMFIEKMGEHSKAIKSVLLDQRVVAGIGNLYSDEILFQSKVHPCHPANELPNASLSNMYTNMRRVLLAAIRVKTDFSLLPRSFILRDRALGKECPRRNGSFECIKVGGRTSYYCPSCQSL